jgi:hypothetical protein
MAWTYEQQIRLQKEYDILNKYFPDMSLVKVAGNDCIEGFMYTNNRTLYKIRLYIPLDLPYSVPDVVIVYPNPVKDFRGNTLVSIGASATMHLLTSKDGYPKICTYKSTNWNSNITFYKILIKVRLWIEALDGHIRTGNSLDYYLKHQL